MSTSTTKQPPERTDPVDFTDQTDPRIIGWTRAPDLNSVGEEDEPRPSVPSALMLKCSKCGSLYTSVLTRFPTNSGVKTFYIMKCHECGFGSKAYSDIKELVRDFERW